MFDHHRAEISVMQFTGHPLRVHQFVTALWDFNLVPYCQPSSPTQSLPITGQRNMQLPPSLEWHVWPGWRSIYNCRHQALLSYCNGDMQHNDSSLGLSLLLMTLATNENEWQLYISHSTNTLKKCINAIILPPAIDKIVKQTGFFSLGTATSLGERKLWI